MFRTMNVFQDHKDLVHDVAYDFHGKRIASCSSDQSVKVWDLNDKGQWICTASWKTHSGSVWRVSWAHPEFGQLLATCSFDRTAVIWEEIMSDSTADKRSASASHWAKRCTLLDSRSNLTDIKFGPRHLGLQLATCSANGVLRVYEAVDIMNLNQFNLQHEIQVWKQRCSAISWSTSKFHAPLLAVGSDDPQNSGGKVSVFEYSESGKKWAKAETLADMTDPVFDVQFAPHIGRSFHLLAVASRNIHIFALKPLQPVSDGTDSSTSEGQTTKFDVKQVARFDAHSGQVWRVSWNITGTILASSGSDATVKMWKANYMDNWKCISTMKSGDGGFFAAQNVDKEKF